MTALLLGEQILMAHSTWPQGSNHSQELWDHMVGIPCNTIIIIRLFNALINKATVNIISVSIPDYRSQNHIAMIVHHNCSKHSSEGFHSTTLSPQLKNYYDGYTQCFDLCNSLTPDIPFKARIIMRSTKIVTCKLNTSLPINMDSSWRLDPPLR